MVCNPTLDVTYKLDKFQLGNNLKNIDYECYPSGKGINIAKVIKKLGEEVAIIGLIPENDLMRFKKHFESLGMYSYLYPVEGNTHINTILFEKSSNEKTHLYSSDYCWPIRIQDEFQDFLKEHIKLADICTLSDSLPKGFDVDAYKKFITACKKENVKVVLDSKGLAFNMGVRARPDIVKPNLEELEAFFGEHIEGVHHIALKGKRLHDMGIKYVFISLGDDGMIAIHENDCLLCFTPKVDAINTKGCGDAFISGFLVAQIRKFSFIESCRMGVACGASNAMHFEPGCVDNDEIEYLMEKVKIKVV